MSENNIHREGQIFPKNGQENTVFMASVPIPLSGIFLKEQSLNSDKVNVWIVQDEEKELDSDLKEAIEGKMDASMTVGKADVSFVAKEELQKKLVEYEIETLGIQPSLKSKMTFEKLPTLETIEIDSTVTTSEILNDTNMLKDQGKLPASYVLDFNVSTLNSGLRMTIRAFSKTFGPIAGKGKTMRNLRERMIDAAVLNERRAQGKSSNKPSQRLILIFT